MSLIIDTPVYARIQGSPEEIRKELERSLTYTDKSVDFAIRNLKNARWFDPAVHGERLEELQSQRRKCLLKEDEDGFYILSGLANYGASLLRTDVVNRIHYPEPGLVPWAVTPPDLRPYQVQARDLLLAANHASVEMGTGLGKSFIILWLCKILGLKAVVMTPSTSIADQIYGDFCTYFGKRRVGRFYGGKKEHDKLFTIAIHASLARIEPDSDAYVALSSASVFIADESHLTPAETLQQVCVGLCKNAPYRFFFSGTQTRGDGAELLLKGIIGPTVFEMTVREGVDQGYLAKPNFKMIRVASNSTFESRDVNKMTAAHFLYNGVINKKAATIANAAYGQAGRAVLILIDEIAQFRELEPLLRHPCAFAYGGALSEENKKYVPEKYRGNDNTQLVKDFNAGKIPILIGTSAISTGTDIKRVQCFINLMGGKSPIQVPQAVGRVTRLFPEINKTFCDCFDFDVVNVDVVHRHAMARVELYNSIYGPVEFL